MPPVRRERSLSAPPGCGATVRWVQVRRLVRPGFSDGGSIGDGAFTLIELLLVTAIIVALAAFAVSGIIGAKQRAAVARSKGELALLAQALESYKRHYGDYPQTGALTQASLAVTADIAQTSAQSALFNALTGVFPPNSTFGAAAAISGPSFIDLTKFQLEQTTALKNSTTTLGVPTSAQRKPVVATSFLDPWSNRYLYYYRRAGTSADPNWRAVGYLLYSAGPDGKLGASSSGTGATDNGLTPATGLYSGTAQTTGFNADNLYADKLP